MELELELVVERLLDMDMALVLELELVWGMESAREPYCGTCTGVGTGQGTGTGTLHGPHDGAGGGGGGQDKPQAIENLSHLHSNVKNQIYQNYSLKLSKSAIVFFSSNNLISKTALDAFKKAKFGNEEMPQEDDERAGN
ncbi:hypothetical protein BpHYR1_031011 [Brachionus plicatilis]|uniref:Uncharacterized protein n=1 Tax=Brachionus plicatilis TaxID=10195 RepID=A0A3M7P7Y0_BRAPC|nr:hypothetical protein BpHYR1_031011 [Brachionus plicatilis]